MKLLRGHVLPIVISRFTVWNNVNSFQWGTSVISFFFCSSNRAIANRSICIMYRLLKQIKKFRFPNCRRTDKIAQLGKMMIGQASALFCIPLTGQC